VTPNGSSRDAVRLAVRHAEHARDVTHGRAGEHRVERPDLGDAVGPYFWVT